MIRNYVDRALSHPPEPRSVVPVWMFILGMVAAGLGAAVGSMLARG